MFRKLVLSMLCVYAATQIVSAQPEFTPDSVVNACKRIAKSRLKSTQHAGWQVGTYYAGIMALYAMTGDRQYLDSAIAWGDHHHWLPNGGDTLASNYDDVCCYQTYLEVYLQDTTQKHRVAAVLKYVQHYTYDTCPGSPSRPSWPIVDMTFMAAPSYPRAALILKDPAINDSLARFSISNATRHWNVKEHLFNSNCSDTTRERNYWARGCGWGLAAQCRILQYLPGDHPSRPWYEDRVRECAGRLAQLQDQSTGLWHSDLNHPDLTPNKETSGTSFFLFGMLFAINNGIIDAQTYLPIVKKAWKGVLDCIRTDGRIGWSQPVGGGPSNNYSEQNNDDYTEGAFFMAANEFHKLLTGTATHPTRSARIAPQASFGPTTAIVRLSAGQRFFSAPANVTGADLYTPNGRCIASLRLRAGVLEMPAAHHLPHHGTWIVRYRYRPE